MARVELRSGGYAHPYRDPAPAPLPGKARVATRNPRVAVLAAPIRGERIVENLVPVANDDGTVATRTKSAATFRIVHVAGVDVAQAFRERDVARASQRSGRGMRDVGELVVGVKRGEMQRDIGTELAHDPFAFGFNFFV